MTNYIFLRYIAMIVFSGAGQEKEKLSVEFFDLDHGVVSSACTCRAAM